MPKHQKILDSFDWKRAFEGVLSEEVGSSIQQDYLEVFKRADAQPALEILSQQVFCDYAFHNQAHTASVLWGVLLLSEIDSLDAIAKENLILASLYHDAGYASGADSHEEKSAKIFQQRTKDSLPADRIHDITELILSTKLHVNIDHISYSAVPRNLLARYLLDADLLNIGFEFRYYCRICVRLLSEQTGRAVDDLDHRQFLDFQRANLQFLNQHKFHTESAARLFSEAKQEKIDRFAVALSAGEQVLRKS